MPVLSVLLGSFDSVLWGYFMSGGMVFTFHRGKGFNCVGPCLVVLSPFVLSDMINTNQCHKDID